MEREKREMPLRSRPDGPVPAGTGSEPVPYTGEVLDDRCACACLTMLVLLSWTGPPVFCVAKGRELP